LMSWEMKEKE
jgi:rRNA methylases